MSTPKKIKSKVIALSVLSACLMNHGLANAQTEPAALPKSSGLAYKKYVFDGGSVVNLAKLNIQKWDGVIPQENTELSGIDLQKIIFSKNEIILSSANVGVKSTNSLEITNLMQKPIFLVRLPEFLSKSLKLKDNDSCKVLESGKTCTIEFEYIPESTAAVSEAIGFFGKYIGVSGHVEAPKVATADNTDMKISGIPVENLKDGIYVPATGSATLDLVNTSNNAISVPAVSWSNAGGVVWSVEGTCKDKTSLSPGESCSFVISSSASGAVSPGPNGGLTIMGTTIPLNYIPPGQEPRAATAADLKFHKYGEPEESLENIIEVPIYKEIAELRNYQIINHSKDTVKLTDFTVVNSDPAQLALTNGCGPGVVIYPAAACYMSVYVGGVIASPKNVSFSFHGKKATVKVNSYDPKLETPNVIARISGGYIPLSTFFLGQTYTGSGAILKDRVFYSNMNSRGVETAALTQASIQDSRFKLVYTDCTGIFKDGYREPDTCSATYAFDTKGLPAGDYSTRVLFAGNNLEVTASISDTAPKPGDIDLQIAGMTRSEDGTTLYSFPKIPYSVLTPTYASVRVMNVSARHLDMKSLRYEDIRLGKGFSVQGSTCYIDQVMPPGGECGIDVRFNPADLPVGSYDMDVSYYDKKAILKQEIYSTLFNPAQMWFVDPSYKKIYEKDFGLSLENSGTRTFMSHMYNSGPYGMMMISDKLIAQNPASPIQLNDLCAGKLVQGNYGYCEMEFTLKTDGVAPGKYENTFSAAGASMKISATVYSTKAASGDLMIINEISNDTLTSIDTGIVMANDPFEAFGGPESSVAFRIKNNSNHVIELKETDFLFSKNIMASSNQCMKVLQPGETCSVIATIDRNQPVGSYQETITLSTGDKLTVLFQAKQPMILFNGTNYYIPGSEMETCMDYVRATPEKKRNGLYELVVSISGNQKQVFNAYCNMEDQGGGWTLVMNRVVGQNEVQGIPLSFGTSSPAVIMTQTAGDDAYDRIFDKSTAALITINGRKTGYSYALSTMASASCKPFNKSSLLADPYLFHDESSGCGMTGSDYTLIGISEGRKNYVSTLSTLPLLFTDGYGYGNSFQEPVVSMFLR